MDVIALSVGWEKMTPEAHLMFWLGEKAEQGEKESKCTSLKSDTDE